MPWSHLLKGKAEESVTFQESGKQARNRRMIVVRVSYIVFRVRTYIYGKFCGGLAQLGERLPCTQEVSGSIPLISTMDGLLAQLVRALA